MYKRQELALGVAALLDHPVEDQQGSGVIHLDAFVDFDALDVREGQAQRGQPRLVLGAHGDLDGVEEAGFDFAHGGKPKARPGPG